MSTNKSLPTLYVIILALIFTALFYKQSLGLNLPIAELLYAALIIKNKELSHNNILKIMLFVAFLFTGIYSVFVHSTLIFFANFLFLGLFSGSRVLEKNNALHYHFAALLLHFVKVPKALAQKISLGNKANGKLTYRLKQSAILLIPTVLIVVFTSIYREANPKFDGVMSGFNGLFVNLFDGINLDIDFSLIFTFILMLFFASLLLLFNAFPKLNDGLKNLNDKLSRKRKYHNAYKTMALKNEYKAAIFLFITLNLLLLVVNFIDIQWVWFNFEWTGQYLKQFVHEGTYLLIFSILLSFAIVLYFFRRNLNFYAKNTLLKRLCYAWLLQNAILSVSVLIRNYHYIQHFALAYKRIAVIAFLILTIFALATVFVKISQKKSMHYIVRMNALSFCVVLFSFSLFGWDEIIANYNFSQKGKAFVHLNFLSQLSDKTLPYLDKSRATIEAIDSFNTEKVGAEEYYLDPYEYLNRIYYKKQNFVAVWEQKSFLEWNYPEYAAYNEITQVK